MLSDQILFMRVILALTLALGIASCSEDLPKQAPVPDEETGTKEDGQSTAGEGEEEMTSSAAGESKRTGASGTSGSGGAGSGTQGKGGAPATAAAGSGTKMPMSEMAGDGGSGGSGGSMMTKAGSGGTAPTVKVVPACMGRAGETICDGAKMIKCGEMFEAAETMPCQSEARCRAGLGGGACGKCDPGVVKCMDAELLECSMAGEMVVKDTCESAALCDEIGKKCDPAKCKADEYSCEGGSLLSCKEDLTDWNQVTACPPELCDAEGKKCNKCLPGMVMCKDDKTLTSCAADGSEETDKTCPMATPICSNDKCVQCLSDDTCRPMSDCQKSTCMNGMCTPVQNLAVESPCSSNGGKVCSLAGTCVACNTDLSCSPSQRCSVVFGCIERQALTVTSLIPGTYTVQVNAGWGLEIEGDMGGEVISVSAIGISTRGSDHRVVLQGNEATQRVVTFRGPSGSGVEANPFLPSLGSACFASPITDTSATLRWSDGSTKPDMDGNLIPAGSCSKVSVRIRAVQ